MNAIYARQSVDRADSISIESQIEFCRYELKGEPYKVYADRGYSGKNTDRPAFGEMMRDMENGTVSPRHRADGDLGAMSLDAFAALLRRVVDSKAKK